MAPGARRVGLHPGLSLRAWLTRHLQMSIGSLGGLLHRPMGSLMTVAVLGIALALPAGLLVLLANLHQVVAGWEGAASVSLFLKPEIGDQAAQVLAGRIRVGESPREVVVMTKSAALEEFRAHSDFGEALGMLEENPLPAVLLVRPKDEDSVPGAAAALTERLRGLPEVDAALLDLQWVQRLQAITEIARRGTYLIAGLLALAVLLIVGNTIRLEIQGRRDEILITKLVGATDAFVRRPFLYQGAWLGLLGGVTAWTLVASAVVALDPAVARLATLYHSAFRLLGPSPLESVALLEVGALVGWLGAWVSVGRHLSVIEPN
jgi:cell division transport system permease protein